MATPVGRVMLASQANNAARSKIAQFPKNIGPHGILMIFNEYRFERPGTRPLLNLPVSGAAEVVRQANGAVLLPLPSHLIDSTSMRITNFEMLHTNGAETMAATAAMSRDAYVNASSAAGFAAQFSKDSAAAIAAGVSNAVNARGADALFMARKLFGDNFLLSNVQQGVGMTVNPKASLMFHGVELKEYGFEWTLAPREEAESDSIREIVSLIKRNVLPSYAAETALSRSMFNYPSTVDMYLLGVDQQHFVQFKTAMVRNFNINYAPNGMSILRGGKPSAVSLSMQFQEMDIHTAGDYGGLGVGDQGEG
jgi:hypothetical protein